MENKYKIVDQISETSRDGISNENEDIGGTNKTIENQTSIQENKLNSQR